MEQCMSPADVKQTKHKQSSGILKDLKKKLRPVRSTGQCSPDLHSVETLQTHSTTDTELATPENKQENESTQSELSVSNDSLSENNTKKKGGKLTGLFQKSPKPTERTLPVQDNLSTHSELSASNDSLSDTNTKEKGGIFSGVFRKSPKPSRGPTPEQDNLSTHSELSASNDSLSDTNTKENESTQSELSVSNDSLSENNTKKNKGKFIGLFRKSPKPAERTLPVQDNLSTHGELSASNDSLSDTNTKEKGGIFSEMFRKSPKPSRGSTPEQDKLSTHSELSDSNDSLSEAKTKMDTEVSQSEATEDQGDNTDNQQDKVVFGGLFWKIPKERTSTFTSYVTDTNPERGTSRPGNKRISSECSPDPHSVETPSATDTELETPENKKENECTRSDLSASNDSISDKRTKEKGGMFSGMFRKSPKPSGGLPPAQENESTHSELSASNDSLSDINTKEKGGIFSGMFRKSPKPSGGPAPEQDNLSTHSDLSGSNDSLSDNNTKQKGGMFTGMFRKSPKPAEYTLPVEVSMETENGAIGDDEMREKTLRRKRRVSFRVKRTLPKAPKLFSRSATKEEEEEEEYLWGESIEMEELPSVQESLVEIQMVEMASLPSEQNLLDSVQDDDGLLEWWRTVDGWDAWNTSSNFKEDEEDLVVEQVADRVYMAAQLFVRLFNQRGASLQRCILELLSVADAADSFHKRTLAASMGGRVASVVGSVTTITGLILAPFTFGSSIIVTAVGIGVATAGTITSASANITDSVHSNMDRKKVEKMIEGYQEEIKDIRECMDFVQEGMDALQERNFEKYTESVAKRALNRNIKHVVKEGARAGKALMINTDKLVSTVQVLSVAGGAAKAAQAISVTTGVMSALFLALDIFFLAKDSHELRKGAKTKFATKIREVCKELQDGLLELNRVKTDLQKTMDGIEVEEYVEEDEDEEEELDLESDPEKLALLEEEINQIEEKLDQRAQEKKSDGEKEREKKKREDDSEEENFCSEDVKVEKGEKEEGRKEDGERSVGKKGKVGSGAGKCGADEKAKEGNQGADESEQRKTENRHTQGGKSRDGDEQRLGVKREGDDRWKSAKREGDEQWKSEKREGVEQRRKEQREGDERWKSAKREGDEQRKKQQREGDEQWKSAKKEGGEQWKSEKREQDAVMNSVPPPTRPRSKAISQSIEESRWEEPVKDPKAPPPVPHRKRFSQREPLSI